MIKYLKQKYLDWKEHRFLKKHGCVDRAHYERKYDPDYNPRATRVKDYYHGYPYIIVLMTLIILSTFGI